MTEKNIDFLKERTNHSLRKEIINITDSYNNKWDNLAELTQNSFDSINKYIKTYGDEIKNHKINIEINSIDRSIRVKDTGMGIESRKVKLLLAPNSTDKDNDEGMIGEKGVGLTYAIFSCNLFQIKTQTTESYFEGEVRSASAWKKGAIEEVPKLEVILDNCYKSEETFTEIYIRDVEKNYDEIDDIFFQDTSVIEYLLRTKTIIGYLKSIFKERNIDIKISLTHINNAGKRIDMQLRFEYMLPSDFINNSKIIDLEEFKKIAATYDDRQKTKKLIGKILRKVGSEQRYGRNINYYCLFVPTRNLWKDICNKNNLFIKNNKGEVIEYLYKGGIYTATKGMPTGIELDNPTTGYSAYWPHFYIIFEDDSIVFDLGRKTIPPKIKRLLKEIAKTLFNEFLPYIKYVTTDPDVVLGTTTTIQQYERSKMFDLIQKLPDLKIDKIPYLKNPDGQEGAIVAIFHELIGAGILRGYYSLKTGYKQTYDLWALYKINIDLVGENCSTMANIKDNIIEYPCVIEFKYKAESILDDFEENIKFFTDIDLIVCWDLDEINFSKQGVEVELIAEEDVFFYGSNYKLSWPGSYNLGNAGEKIVLSLRKFIMDYIGKQNK